MDKVENLMFLTFKIFRANNKKIKFSLNSFTQIIRYYYKEEIMKILNLR